MRTHAIAGFALSAILAAHSLPAAASADAEADIVIYCSSPDAISAAVQTEFLVLRRK